MRSVLVTRTLLELPDLQLWQTGKYFLPEGTFGPGETSQNAETVSNALVKGAYPTLSAEGERVGNIGVHVQAQVDSDLQPRVEEVINAMTQFMFILTWNYGNKLGGVWRCRAGDWALGQQGIIDEPWLKAIQQTVYFTVPHNRISGL